MKVTIEHARALGYCAKGMKLFAEKNNLDFKVFVKEGFEEQTVIDTNDSMAYKLLEQARKETN